MLNNSTEITQMRYFHKYTCSDRPINLYVLWDACHELFRVLRDFNASGVQDAEVQVCNKSLLMIVFLSLKGGKFSVPVLETAVSDQDCQ